MFAPINVMQTLTATAPIFKKNSQGRATETLLSTFLTCINAYSKPSKQNGQKIHFTICRIPYSLKQPTQIAGVLYRAIVTPQHFRSIQTGFGVNVPELAPPSEESPEDEGDHILEAVGLMGGAGGGGGGNKKKGAAAAKRFKSAISKRVLKSMSPVEKFKMGSFIDIRQWGHCVDVYRQITDQPAMGISDDCFAAATAANEGGGDIGGDDGGNLDSLFDSIQDDEQKQEGQQNDQQDEFDSTDSRHTNSLALDKVFSLEVALHCMRKGKCTPKVCKEEVWRNLNLNDFQSAFAWPQVPSATLCFRIALTEVSAPIILRSNFPWSPAFSPDDIEQAKRSYNGNDIESLKQLLLSTIGTGEAGGIFETEESMTESILDLYKSKQEAALRRRQEEGEAGEDGEGDQPLEVDIAEWRRDSFKMISDTFLDYADTNINVSPGVRALNKFAVEDTWSHIAMNNFQDTLLEFHLPIQIMGICESRFKMPFFHRNMLIVLISCFVTYLRQKRNIHICMTGPPSTGKSDLQAKLVRLLVEGTVQDITLSSAKAWAVNSHAEYDIMIGIQGEMPSDIMGKQHRYSAGAQIFKELLSEGRVSGGRARVNPHTNRVERETWSMRARMCVISAGNHNPMDMNEPTRKRFTCVQVTDQKEANRNVAVSITTEHVDNNEASRSEQRARMMVGKVQSWANIIGLVWRISALAEGRCGAQTALLPQPDVSIGKAMFQEVCRRHNGNVDVRSTGNFENICKILALMYGVTLFYSDLCPVKLRTNGQRTWEQVQWIARHAVVTVPMALFAMTLQEDAWQPSADAEVKRALRRFWKTYNNPDISPSMPSSSNLGGGGSGTGGGDGAVAAAAASSSSSSASSSSHDTTTDMYGMPSSSFPMAQPHDDAFHRALSKIKSSRKQADRAAMKQEHGGVGRDGGGGGGGGGGGPVSSNMNGMMYPQGWFNDAERTSSMNALEVRRRALDMLFSSLEFPNGSHGEDQIRQCVYQFEKQGLIRFSKVLTTPGSQHDIMQSAMELQFAPELCMDPDDSSSDDNNHSDQFETKLMEFSELSRDMIRLAQFHWGDPGNCPDEKGLLVLLPRGGMLPQHLNPVWIPRATGYFPRSTAQVVDKLTQACLSNLDPQGKAYSCKNRESQEQQQKEHVEIQRREAYQTHFDPSPYEHFGHLTSVQTYRKFVETNQQKMDKLISYKQEMEHMTQAKKVEMARRLQHKKRNRQ